MVFIALTLTLTSPCCVFYVKYIGGSITTSYLVRRLFITYHHRYIHISSTYHFHNRFATVPNPETINLSSRNAWRVTQYMHTTKVTTSYCEFLYVMHPNIIPFPYTHCHTFGFTFSLHSNTWFMFADTCIHAQLTYYVQHTYYYAQHIVCQPM